jgi:hypothetical protein
MKTVLECAGAFAVLGAAIGVGVVAGDDAPWRAIPMFAAIGAFVGFLVGLHGSVDATER